MKKVNFAMSDKENEELEKQMRGIVLEKVKRVKQERLKVEKIKVEMDERNAKVIERLEMLEKKLEHSVEKLTAKMEALVQASEKASLSETTGGARGSAWSLHSKPSMRSEASGMCVQRGMADEKNSCRSG